jgi:hypothetical protein
MKKQRSLIKRTGNIKDALGQLHCAPGKNRPGGRLRLPKLRNGQVVSFRSPSTGDPGKQTSNNPCTNTEVIREYKQLHS